MHRDYRYVHWIAVDPSETVFSFRVGTMLQVITIRLRKTGMVEILPDSRN